MFDQSKSAKQAEDYIRYTTRQNVKQRDLIDEYGNIKVDSRKSTTINHVELANTIIKLVGVVPMSPYSRKVLLLKVSNPGITMTGVSLQTGLLAHEIKAYEKEGINRVSDYMRRTDIQEGIDRFNRDSTVENAVKNLNMQGKDNSLLK